MNKSWKFTEHYIIDTCYLMNQKPLISDLERLTRKRIGLVNNIRRQIPESVMIEIGRNNTISDKKVASNAARKVITSYDNNYTEVKKKDIKHVRIRQGKIGVDSDTDLDVVSLAIDTAKKNPHDIIIVLSHDTGIQVELSNWKSCKNLFYLEAGRILKYKKNLADKMNYFYKSFGPFWVVLQTDDDSEINNNYPMVIDALTFTEYMLKKEEPAKKNVWYKWLYRTGEEEC